MKIILLRHGESVWNKERRFQGYKDIPLTLEGEEQIRQAGKNLAGTKITIDQIIASPLGRTRRSAEIIAEEIRFPLEKIESEPLWIERGLGVCEGMTFDEAWHKYPDKNYPGMETIEELCSRVEKAITKCIQKYPEQNLLIVSHNGTIKGLIEVLTNGGIRFNDKISGIDNGSYFLLEKSECGWTIDKVHPTIGKERIFYEGMVRVC